jgi:hypothetical protein
MCGECHECVDASAASCIGVGDAEDVGGGVACEGVAEEYRSAGCAGCGGGATGKRVIDEW